MGSSLLKYAKKLSVELIVLIFIMGFFSNTVSNFFLPDIYGTKILLNQNIIKSMPINGTIQPKETNRVLLNEDIVIKNFFVNVGDGVKVGDPIFEIDQSYGNIKYSNEARELYLKIEKEELNKEKIKKDLEMKERSIQKMEESIEKEKNSLNSKIELYEIGSISKTELNRAEDNIKELEGKLEIEKEDYEVLKKEAELNIKNIENNISNIRKEIQEANKDSDFYAKISSDGVYYSEVNGTVLSISDTGQILRKEIVISEIAIVEGYDSIKFVGYVNENDDDFINIGDVFSLKEISKDKKIEATVSYKSRVAKDQRIKVEAYFNKPDELQGNPLIGGRLEGRISKEEKGAMVVPKASIIPSGRLEEGQQGFVYIIDEKDGLLGKKYFAKQVTVSILKIGDDKVEVTGLESNADKMIITNLSYKIRDGVRIKWQ